MKEKEYPLHNENTATFLSLFFFFYWITTSFITQTLQEARKTPIRIAYAPWLTNFFKQCYSILHILKQRPKLLHDTYPRIYPNSTYP